MAVDSGLRQGGWPRFPQVRALCPSNLRAGCYTYPTAVENIVPDSPATPSQRLKGIGYRFALLLTGAPEAAAAIFRAVLADTAEPLSQLRSRERRRALLVRHIRAYAAKWREAQPSPSPVPESATAAGRIAALPEPSRSVAALFYSAEMPVEEMALLLELKQDAFINALAEARRLLYPGVTLPSNPLLAEHRPWGGDRPRVVKAVGKAGDTPEFAAQVEADRRLQGEVAAAEVPRDILDLVLAVPARPRLRVLIFQPAVLAILLAIIVVLGTFAYLAKTRMGNFPGRDTAEELVEYVGTTGEYEPFPPVEAGSLDDWFVLKGFAGFNVPPQLEKALAVGGRVFRHEGVLLAEVELKTGNARLLVFHLEDLKKERFEPGRQWRIFQDDDYAVAVTRDDANGYIVLFEGDSDDMPAFLNSFGGQ